MSSFGRACAKVVGLGAAIGALGCAQILGLEESTVVDAAVADSASDSLAPDTFVGDGDTGDASPANERSVTVFFAAPDQAKTYLCVTVFDADSPPGPPSGSYGPYGSTSGFAYPSTFPLPAEAMKAFATKRVAILALGADPGTSDPDACKKLFKDTMDTNPGRITVFPIGSVKSGDAVAVALTGCSGNGSALFGACGPGSNLKLSQVKLDTANPSPGKLGVQVLDLSVFDETASPGPPNLKQVDAWLNSYDASRAKKSEEKIASGVDALTVSPRFDATPPPGTIPFLLLYTPGSSPCAFTPETMPPMGCAIAPVDLHAALLEAQSHSPSVALAAGQSLVLAFAGTPRGDMTKPPSLFGMIARIR